MKSYKILIVAWYAGIFHVSEFIRNLKKTNPFLEISLLTSKPTLKEVPEDVIACTSEILCFKYYSGKVKCRLFGELINRFYFLKTFYCLSRKRYDIVNIHFARPRLVYVLHWIKKISDNIVISPWGSDVMRVEKEKKIKQLKRVYLIANYITIPKESALGQQVIEKFCVNPQKMVNLEWGGELFDYIKDNPDNVTIEEAKERFGLRGKYVITCGYNTQVAQRHHEIVNAIFSVKDILPNNLILLFPFTYGRTLNSDIYTNSIKDKCIDLGLDFVAVEERLNLGDLLKLRMATDMFVHVQTTDAGSRCVMEYVACNKKVVHGSWIRYAYLDDYKPSCYFPVDKMENLGECIVDAYRSIVYALPVEVKEIIMERGWKHKMALWNGFFESLL